jgi:hypothetical protein
MKWITGADNMYEGIETFMFLFNSKNDFKNIFAENFGKKLAFFAQN